VDKESNKVYSNFHNQLLFVETKISSSDLKKLKDKAKLCLETEDKFSKANNFLAGNMEKEFNLNESFEKILFPYSSSLANEYNNLNNKTLGDTKKQVSSWVSTGSWINFQKKHEFNPIHDHTGTYSFVLWIQIPYNLEEELKLDNCKNSNTERNSLFSFTHLNQYGEIVTTPLKIDKTWEGTMILFSSRLKHEVYPFFTSDDYRISISGNLVKKISSKKTFSYQ
jgi:hypothetical protein|tara:strand:+ start:147 stop:818 length:672 start_codon:yes stop_codon:yes gene_type:complete